MDEQIVTKEGAVPKEAVSKPEEAKLPVELKTPEPLSEERVAQLVAEAVKKERGEIERHFQSLSDKRVGQAEFKTRQAEARHKAMQDSLRGMNPAQADKVRLADLEAQARFQADQEEEERQRQNQTAFDQSFTEGITTHIESLDIDPTDKRVDWAKDERDYVVKQRRILASVAKIGKEDFTKKQENSAKEIEAKLRKELGLDSADAFVSSSGGSGELGSALRGKNPKQAREALDKFIKGG